MCMIWLYSIFFAVKCKHNVVTELLHTDLVFNNIRLWIIAYSRSTCSRFRQIFVLKKLLFYKADNCTIICKYTQNKHDLPLEYKCQVLHAKHEAGVQS